MVCEEDFVLVSQALEEYNFINSDFADDYKIISYRPALKGESVFQDGSIYKHSGGSSICCLVIEPFGMDCVNRLCWVENAGDRFIRKIDKFEDGLYFDDCGESWKEVTPLNNDEISAFLK